MPSPPEPQCIRCRRRAPENINLDPETPWWFVDLPEDQITTRVRHLICSKCWTFLMGPGKPKSEIDLEKLYRITRILLTKEISAVSGEP